MGDGKSGAALDQSCDRILNLPFGISIDRGGRRVENQNAPVVQDSTRDADALPLATAERQAAFAHLRVITVGLLENEVVSIGCLGRSHNVLARGAGPGKGDVLINRTAEEKG